MGDCCFSIWPEAILAHSQRVKRSIDRIHLERPHHAKPDGHAPLIEVEVSILSAILQVLGQLRGKLHGLLVVTSSVVPVDLAAALLRSGARCVICKDAAAAVPTATAAADFFSSFYSHLFAGMTILSAMASAGQPPLPSLVCKGKFCRDWLCYHYPLS